MQASLSPVTSFSLGGQVAIYQANGFSSPSAATAASAAAATSRMTSALLPILWITTAPAEDLQALPDPSLHAQLDGGVICLSESLMKPLFVVAADSCFSRYSAGR